MAIDPRCPECGIVHFTQADWCMPVGYTELQALAEQGLVRRQQVEDLVIFKYGREAMFGSTWTPAMQHARGVVYNTAGEQVNNVLPKFFNYGNLESKNLLPGADEFAHVYKKYDGSMITVFKYGGEWRVASSGSLDSVYSKTAMNMLRSKYGTDALADGYTYMFELLADVSANVVSYEQDSLVLLAAWNTAGVEAGPYELPGLWPDVARTVDRMAEHVDNAEGYVLRWPTGARVKIKFDAYVELHKQIGDFSDKRVCEWIVDGVYDDLYDVMPEHMRERATVVADEFRKNVAEIKSRSLMQFSLVSSNADRAEQAEIIKQHTYPFAEFMLLDGDTESYERHIFKLAMERTL